MRDLIVYLVSILIAYLIGSIAGTETMFRALQSMSFEIAPISRMEIMIADLIGLSGTLLPMMAGSLSIGWMSFDWYTKTRLSWRHPVNYALLGFTIIFFLHPLVNFIVGVEVYAPVRTWLGLLIQALAGGVGGFCLGFYRYTKAGLLLHSD